MINFIQTNIDIKEKIKIIDNNILEDLLITIKKEKDNELIISLINEISLTYNIDKKNLLKLLFNKIWNFIKEKILKQSAIKNYNEEQLKNIVLDIVDDVLKADYKKFIRSYSVNESGEVVDTKGTIYEQKYYNETLEKDPYAKSIITKLFQHPFINYKLSGSQVLRKYGIVLRAINEDMHDIDGVIPLETFRKEKNALEFYEWARTRGLMLSRAKRHKQFMKELTPFIENQSWYKNIKDMFPTWNLLAAFIGRDHKEAE